MARDVIEDLAEDLVAAETRKVDAIEALLEQAETLSRDLAEGGEDFRAAMSDALANLRFMVPDHLQACDVIADAGGEYRA